MPARAPASRARRGRRETETRTPRGENALRRRRRNLHRRSLLHSPLRMPVADGKAEPGSLAHRSGRDRDRELRRLRIMRRGRARPRALPLLLSRRGGAKRECMGSRAAYLPPKRDRLAWRARGAGVNVQPLKLLIAALGGEGGGVLTDWIVTAAEKRGFPVQSTSIPGVAQRTGATTYYIEIVPMPAQELGGKRPVLALTPGIADIDIALASELMEAGRLIANGFVTSDRPAMIASTSRFYAMDEKIAMADGRYDFERLSKAIRDNAKSALLFDMAEAAKNSGAIVNAVMLGALAGSGHLPIPAEALEAGIKSDAKGAGSNLKGFRAGLDAARSRDVSAAP